jgi:hypothetical protein
MAENLDSDGKEKRGESARKAVGQTDQTGNMEE